MGSVEADGLRRLMDQQHQQNRGDIDELKRGQADLTKEVTTLAGEVSGGVKTLKFLGWLIGVVIAGLGLWFASLESRGKISDNKPPAAISSSQSITAAGAATMRK